MGTMPERRGDGLLKKSLGGRVASHNCCLLSRPRVMLQISSYQNSSRCWVGTDSKEWPKIPFTPGIECLKLRDHGDEKLKHRISSIC